MLDAGRELEGVAGPDHHVRHLADVERAVAVGHAEHFGGRQRHRAQCLVPRHAVGHGVAGLLAQVARVVGIGLEQGHLHAGSNERRRVLVAHAEGVVRRDVVEGLDEHRHPGAGDRVRDLPGLLAAGEDHPQPELPPDTQRRLDVAAAIHHHDHRQRPAEDRL